MQNPSLQIINLSTYVHRLPAYQEFKTNFELDHFQFRDVFVTIQEDGTLNFQSERTFKIENRRFKIDVEYNNKKYEERIINSWLQDKNLRYYKGVDFYPKRSDCPENVYNLFTGFSIETNRVEYNPEEQTDLIQPFLNFIQILTQFSNVNEYVLNWICHLFQYPEKKGSALFIHGSQGTGKTTLLELISRICGKQYYKSSGNPSFFFAKHSTFLENTLLANLDGIEITEPTKQSGLLKAWIKEPTVYIYSKKFNPRLINNSARFVLTSNNVISLKNRRYFSFEASNVLSNNTEYFNNLYAYFDDKKRLTAFYDYLMSRDISNFNVINDIPQIQT